MIRRLLLALFDNMWPKSAIRHSNFNGLPKLSLKIPKNENASKYSWRPLKTSIYGLMLGSWREHFCLDKKSFRCKTPTAHFAFHELLGYLSFMILIIRPHIQFFHTILHDMCINWWTLYVFKRGSGQDKLPSWNHDFLFFSWTMSSRLLWKIP